MRIHEDVVHRYVKIVEKHPKGDFPEMTGPEHLMWMLDQIHTCVVGGDKAHRWLGFVQGILISRGLASVNEERDFTRPYFTVSDK